MVEQNWLSPQVKRSVIIISKLLVAKYNNDDDDDDDDNNNNNINKNNNNNNNNELKEALQTHLLQIIWTIYTAEKNLKIK